MQDQLTLAIDPYIGTGDIDREFGSGADHLAADHDREVTPHGIEVGDDFLDRIEVGIDGSKSDQQRLGRDQLLREFLVLGGMAGAEPDLYRLAHLPQIAGEIGIRKHHRVDDVFADENNGAVCVLRCNHA